MKRLLLFLATNLAVLVTLGIVANVLVALLGTSVAELIGPEWSGLAIFAFVYGFIGAFISLLLSKPIAKFACRAQTIDGSEGPAERWLVDTVGELARRANVKMPEVAIYPGTANAFATGAFRNHALVAVSTDILEQMSKEELRAVLGHEMSHVANGDMVTLTLVQGVLNAFVLFFSRALASLAVRAGSDDRGRRGANNGLYFLLVMVFDIVLGLLATLVVCAFSRRREFAADAGSARLLGSPGPMIDALRRLGNLRPGVLPDSLKAMGIAEGDRKTSVWATHPSLSARIAALRELQNNPPA
ncbi:MAG TPA: protease HtpX [Verrucomicrobia bacterium]|nr:protease HtpX [Verrucomicrobiota bacterium]